MRGERSEGWSHLAVKQSSYFMVASLNPAIRVDEMALYLSYKDPRAALRDKWVHAPSKPREMSNLVRPPVGLHFCSFKFNGKVSGSVFVQTSIRVCGFLKNVLLIKIKLVEQHKQMSG